MKYKKCPRCGLNYILLDEELCKVCLDEMAGRKSIFDEVGDSDLICPYCEKRLMGIDDVMSSECLAKRSKKTDDT